MCLVFIIQTYRIKWCITHKCVTVRVIHTNKQHSMYTIYIINTHMTHSVDWMYSKWNCTCTPIITTAREGNLHFLGMVSSCRCSRIHVLNVTATNISKINIKEKKSKKRFEPQQQKWRHYVTISQINFFPSLEYEYVRISLNFQWRWLWMVFSVWSGWS